MVQWTAVLALLSVCATAAAQHEEPAFVDRKIAGADLVNWYDFEFGFDKEKGYYLVYDGE